MATLHLSNGRAVKTDQDYEKVVARVSTKETIVIDGVTYFTKHVLYIDR